MTMNHHRHTPYLQQAQVIYKAGVLGWDTCSILRQAVRIGLPSIALPREERSPRDEGIIKLLLYLLRNVAVIRQVPNLPSQGLEMGVSRSATIEAFREQDVLALLLTICSNMGEDFNLQDVIVLEILFNLVKGVDVKKLWMTQAQRKHQDMSDLKSTLAAEKDMFREAKKIAPTRHNRFGTMIWVKRQGDKTSALSGQDNLNDGRALFNMDSSKKWSNPQRQAERHRTPPSMISTASKISQTPPPRSSATLLKNSSTLASTHFSPTSARLSNVKRSASSTSTIASSSTSSPGSLTLSVDDVKLRRTKHKDPPMWPMTLESNHTPWSPQYSIKRPSSR